MAAALVMYGNIVSALSGSTGTGGWRVVPFSYAFLALVLVWTARQHGLSRREIGLTTRGLARGVAVGAAVGIALILPVVVYFAFPVGAPGGSVDYEEAEGRSLGRFLIWALVRQPIAITFFEETMFRGVLQTLAVRAFDLWRGVVLTALAFALWHVVVNLGAVGATSFGEELPWRIAAHAGSMLGLAVGGVVFGVLRLTTGNLAAPMAFHWVVVVAMQGVLSAAD